MTYTPLYIEVFLQALVSWIHPDEYLPASVPASGTFKIPPTPTLPSTENESHLLTTNLSVIFTSNCTCGFSANNCTECEERSDPTLKNVFLALILYMFCCATVFGNSLVIAAVFKVRRSVFLFLLLYFLLLRNVVSILPQII